MLQSDEMSVSNLCSIKMPDLLIPIANASCVMIGKNIYLAGGAKCEEERSEIVQVYNMDTGKWSTLLPAPQYWSEAIDIDKNLVLIGGYDTSTGKTTNMVSTWLIKEEKWTQNIPPMITKRARPGVLLLKKFLFVFGGLDEGSLPLHSFEVLDIEKNQWSSGHGLLPRPLYGLKLGVFGDAAVLASPWVEVVKPSYESWEIPVHVLEDSVTTASSQPIQWTPIADTPYKRSSLLTNSKQPILVGGHKGGQPTKEIYRYVPDHWEHIGQLSEARIRSSAVAINCHAFMVFSGCTVPHDPLHSPLDTVELILHVPSS